MKVLIACEFSGIVREAFKRRGHDAWSCDLLPTEMPGQHIQGDVSAILNNGWDLMVGFPPCACLARSGLRWIIKDDERKYQMILAAKFFNDLLGAPIPLIAIENPTQHRFARELIRKPDQSIEPFMFGHINHKKT
jgi:hypothetical protein